MLRDIPGQDQDELIKPIEIGDLSMRPDNKAVDNLDKPEFLEKMDSPPESRFATTSRPGRVSHAVLSSIILPVLVSLAVLGYERLFRVNIAIIREISEESQGNLDLAWSQSKHSLETTADTIKTLEEQSW